MRRSHSSDRARAARGVGLYRPQLLILEDRLPPGDAVLGALLAPGLLGPDLVWDSGLASEEVSGSSFSALAGVAGPASLDPAGLANVAALPALLAGQPEQLPQGDRPTMLAPLPESGATASAPGWFRDAGIHGLAENEAMLSAAIAGPGLPPDARFWAGWTGITGAGQGAGRPGVAHGSAANELAGLAAWLRGASSKSASLAADAVSDALPLHFNPATGLLAIQGDASGAAVGEGTTAGGFLEVTLAGRTHSSDPDAAAFDPALAGARATSLRGIRLAGGPNARLVLAGQSLAGGLTVQADGAVVVTGNVTAAGPVAITAAAITVRSTLQGPALNLASTGLLNVEAGGVVTAAQSGQGGQVALTAGVLINVGQIDADGGHGGHITVQADKVLQGGRLSADSTAAAGGTVQVGFGSAYVATAAALTAADGVAGGQVHIDGQSTGRLFSSGRQEALGRTAAGGDVMLRGGDIALVGATVDASGAAGSGSVVIAAARPAEARDTPAAAAGWHLVDPHPTRTGAFGFTITPLRNGNVVVTAPHDDFVAPEGGAVYLFQGGTGVLLGSLVGNAAGDLVGDGGGPGDGGPGGAGPVGPVGDGVVPLTNGNYVVLSPRWNDYRGAATWADGSVGVTGTVDATNSLVGSNSGNPCYSDNSGDCVGYRGITALSTGNYVVRSPYWNSYRGAATWADGSVGVTGPVDPTNSLVGSNPGNSCDPFNSGDCVGSGGITALSTGNYVVVSPDWNGYRGAATWADGSVGVTGTVDVTDSLVGGNSGNPCDSINSGDCVGSGGITALSSGNYVVASPDWNGFRGSATWADGSVGLTGIVDATNSLVGSNSGNACGLNNSGDCVGVSITALSSGNYVVASPDWNSYRGAATWVDGSTGLTGPVDATNSLVGSNPGDQVGERFNDRVGITALSSGNYVVASPNWNGRRGAVTWADGRVGLTGIVDPTNSLVGSNSGNRCDLFNSGDCVGYGGITALSSGNYVVASPDWNGGFPNGLGAATWADGSAGITGPVDPTNSLVGSHPGDSVSSFNITVLSSGNYVVRSPYWNGGRGAATWADGSVGLTGPVDDTNSLVG